MRNEPTWAPEDHFTQIGETVLRLISGLESARDWSKEVRAALRAHLDFVARFKDQTRANPNADAQLRAGALVALQSIALYVARNPHPSPEERIAFVEATQRRVDRSMRAVAGRQQRRRAALNTGQAGRVGRPRKPEPLHSVLDGWHWRGGGRPSQHPVTGLLLRLEVWRDVRARARPEAGRVSRARALAEVLVYDLRDEDPQLYARVEQRRAHYADDEVTRDSLVHAMTALNRKYFTNLQVQFSQALSAVGVRGSQRSSRRRCSMG